MSSPASYRPPWPDRLFVDRSGPWARTSAGQFNINSEGLSAISVPVPPLRLQREFLQRQERIKRAIQRAEDHAVQLDELFASLQHRAFSGAL